MEMIAGVPNPELMDLVEQKVKATGIKMAIHIHGNRETLYPDAASVCPRDEVYAEPVAARTGLGHDKAPSEHFR